MNNALISIGSNMPIGETNIRKAILLIQKKARMATFSSIYDTEPEGEHRHAKYKNCVGQITTTDSYQEWESFFKKTEIMMGRNNELRRLGEVPIDLDIIIWNEEVKRPKDLNREYLKDGLIELGEYK